MIRAVLRVAKNVSWFRNIRDYNIRTYVLTYVLTCCCAGALLMSLLYRGLIPVPFLCGVITAEKMDVQMYVRDTMRDALVQCVI